MLVKHHATHGTSQGNPGAGSRYPERALPRPQRREGVPPPSPPASPAGPPGLRCAGTAHGGRSPSRPWREMRTNGEKGKRRITNLARHFHPRPEDGERLVTTGQSSWKAHRPPPGSRLHRIGDLRPCRQLRRRDTPVAASDKPGFPLGHVTSAQTSEVAKNRETSVLSRPD